MRRKIDYNEVLNFIIEYKETHDGNSPTIRQIARGCAISSTSVVTYILRWLEAADKIRLVKNGSRKTTIEVIGGAWKYTPIS